MPEEPAQGDLESRTTRIEREVVRLRDHVEVSRAEARAARLLAAGADRDVSEVRAELRQYNRVLNALRETQIEHGQRLFGLERRMGGLEAKFVDLETKVDLGFQEMRQGFGTMSAGMAQIVALLDRPRPDDTPD